MINYKKIILASCMLLGITGVNAQTAEPESSLQLGVNSLYMPAFVGSKDYNVFLLPDYNLNYQDTFFLTVEDGARYALIKKSGWSFGPVAEVAMARNEDGDSIFRVGGPKTTALAGLGNVNTTLNVGGFASYDAKHIKGKVDLMQGIGGAPGVVTDMKVNYVNNIGYFYYAIGPKALFGNGQYLNDYWGINNQQAINSGLPTYHTNSGLVFYGVRASGLMPISKTMLIAGFVEYDRLAPQVANSPLVQQRGSANQLSVDLSWDYYFKF